MAGFSLPTVGQPNSTEDSKVLTALTGLNDLAAAYRTLLTVGTANAGQTVVGSPYFFTANGISGNNGAATTSSASGGVPMGFQYLTADNAVTGLTQFMRIKLQVLVGATSPSTTVITTGLYPLTISAGNYAMGTVVAGSTVASSGLTTNTISPFTGTDFNVSALTNNTYYILGFAITSATVPSGITTSAQLQVRNA